MDMRLWKDSPCGFVSTVLGSALWSRQRSILEAVRDHPRIAVKSCNGSGKTFTAAQAILWWVYTRPEGIAITTAPTARQVEELLWREVRQAYWSSRNQLGGKLTRTSLEIGPRNFALGVSTDRGERFQGFHAGDILFVVDEASGVREEIFDAMRGSMTSANAKMLLIGNPTRLEGTFFDAFHRHYDLWHTITISAQDCIGADDRPANADARLVTAEWVDEMRQLFGTASSQYRIRVDGDFPDNADDQLIPRSSIQQAIDRWNAANARGGARRRKPSHDDAEDPVVVGLDVARFGGDRNVACVRQGTLVLELEDWKGVDTMTTVGRAMDAARRHGASTIIVDSAGIGGGVLDRMREVESGINCIGVNVGKAARNRERYANLRAELHWGLRMRFQNGDIAIPDDGELVAELTRLRYTFNSLSQVQIVGKHHYSGTAGNPSPDKADALMLAFSGMDGGAALEMWSGKEQPAADGYSGGGVRVV